MEQIQEFATMIQKEFSVKMQHNTATETYPKLVFFTLKKLRVFAP